MVREEFAEVRIVYKLAVGVKAERDVRIVSRMRAEIEKKQRFGPLEEV